MRRIGIVLLAQVLGAVIAAPHGAAAQTAQSGFPDGAEVAVAVDVVNVRSGPGLGHEIIGELYGGTALTIVGEPEYADGFTWYQVQLRGATTFGTGAAWVAGEVLAYPDGGTFPIGAQVVTTAPDLWVRDGPGVGSNVIGSVNLGAPLTVVGEPVGADGFTWYEVQLRNPDVGAASSGAWVAGEFLAYE